MTPPAADLPRPLARRVIRVGWRILIQGSRRAAAACAVVLAVPGTLLLAGRPISLAQVNDLLAHHALASTSLLLLLIGLRGLWMMWRVLVGEEGLREGDAFVLGLCGLLGALPLSSLSSVLLTVVLLAFLFSALGVLLRPWVQARPRQPWIARGLL